MSKTKYVVAKVLLFVTLIGVSMGIFCLLMSSLGIVPGLIVSLLVDCFVLVPIGSLADSVLDSLYMQEFRRLDAIKMQKYEQERIDWNQKKNHGIFEVINTTCY